MKLSIIIVNYNVKYFTEQCLNSVRAATSGLETEVFVVDNNSSDDSVNYLKPLFPEVHFIANSDNPGFAKANNQAIRQSTGQYVLLLNPDTIVGEELFRSLLYFMDEHPEAGAAGVKMIDGHGVFLPESKRAYPSPWVSFCKIFGLAKIFPNSPKYAKYALPYLDENKQHEVEVLAGAFMFMRRAALDKSGLLDEDFFMYGEDIDLSYRIVQSGFKNYYLPERILHYKGESTKKSDVKYIKSFYGAMLIFYRKHYPESSFLMQSLIKSAVFGKATLSGIGGKLGFKKKPKEKHNRLLILCNEAHFEQAKTALTKLMPELEYVNLWDLDSEHVMDAICRRNQMKGFTDIAFCYPDVRFEQMLLFMDKMVNKKINYHIFNLQNNCIIS